MCRHDVPEQHVLLDAELREHAVDDRRRRLRRAVAGQLPLGGERDAADARAAVAGRLADEHDGRVTPGAQVRLEPLPAQPRAAVLVEGLADPGPGESVYQCSQRTTSSSGFHGNLDREPRTASGPGWPIVTAATGVTSSGTPSAALHALASWKPNMPAPRPSSIAHRSRSMIALPASANHHGTGQSIS